MPQRAKVSSSSMGILSEESGRVPIRAAFVPCGNNGNARKSSGRTNCGFRVRGNRNVRVESHCRRNSLQIAGNFLGRPQQFLAASNVYDYRVGQLFLAAAFHAGRDGPSAVEQGRMGG